MSVKLYFFMILHNSQVGQRYFINPQIRHKAIMDKMQSLLNRKQQTKTSLITFYNYIIECLNIYDVFFRKFTEDAERQLQGQQFTSSKCRQIRNYYTKIVKMSHIYLDYNFNNLKEVSDLSCVGLSKTQQKMNQKYELFITAKVDYLRSEHSYTKSYEKLEKKSNLLKQKLNLLSKYNNPIKFYNQTQVSACLNELEKQYYQCQSMQKDTRNEENLLNEKQNWLKNILDEIADKFVGMVKESMQKIVKVCQIMVQMNGNSNGGRISNGEELLDDGVDEMKRYQQIYSRNNVNSNQFMQNFSQFFSQNKLIIDECKCNQLLLINQRCKLVKQKQIKDITQMIKHRKIFIESIKRHREMFMDLDKNIKQAKKKFIASEHFNNNIQNFRRQFEKCFGKNVFQIEQLSILLLQNLNEVLQQLSTMIKSKNIIMFQSILETEQRQMERFEKSANQILKEHNQLQKKTSFQNTPQNAQKNKKYCLNAFEQFRILFREISNSREERDQVFNKMVSQFNAFLHNNVPNSQQQLLKRQYNKYEKFINIIPANEVMDIMKNDQIYDVLFGDIRNAQDASRFQSPISISFYEKIRKILVDKNSYQKNIALQMRMKKNSFCCCSPRRTKNDIKQYPCSIDKNGSWVTGNLFINRKFFYFQGQKYFFKKSVNILILFTQIKEQPIIQQKTKTLILQTKMGPIHLQSDLINIILQHLKSQLAFNNYNIEENSSRPRSEYKKLLSMNSIEFDNGMRKIYDVMLPRQKQGSNVDTTITQTNSQIANRLLKKFHQLPVFFSDNFEVVRKDQQKKRINYLYERDFFKFELYQLWTIQSSIFGPDDEESKILLKFNWKIIPKTDQSMSFLHNEKIIIQLKNDQVLIKIYESPRKSWEKYISKIFYNQIASMNENMNEDIHHESHRKCRIQYFLNYNEQQGAKQILKKGEEDIFDMVPIASEKFCNIGSSTFIKQSRSLIS